MKVMVTGAQGQLGQDVVCRLMQAGLEVIDVDADDFDLTDTYAVMDFVTTQKPDAIIHCAAYTSVDRAEHEVEKCCRVNGLGTDNLVRAALRVRAKFMFISTDYGFSGAGNEPHETDEHRRPQNIYGQSKMQGEVAVRSQMTAYFIVRTSWLFSTHGNNFVRTILEKGREKGALNVVDDQIGSPTYAWDLAGLLVNMIQTEKYGLYHATNEGVCSWAEFAEEILRQAGVHCTVRHVPSSAYKTDARRPLNSVLSKKSLDEAGFSRLPLWQDALTRCLEEMHVTGTEQTRERI